MEQAHMFLSAGGTQFAGFLRWTRKDKVSDETRLLRRGEVQTGQWVRVRLQEGFNCHGSHMAHFLNPPPVSDEQPPKTERAVTTTFSNRGESY